MIIKIYFIFIISIIYVKNDNEIFDKYAKVWNSYSFVQENIKNFIKFINEKNF